MTDKVRHIPAPRMIRVTAADVLAAEEADERRKALIEEAAKAIYENERRTIDPGWPAWEYCRDGSKESVLDAARDAFAVFEKAHTPTDEERTYLAGAIRSGFYGLDSETPDEEDYAIADAVLAAGFRRSEVPEPSVLPTFFTPKPGSTTNRLVSEPQGEPSDAQVLAARRAYNDAPKYRGMDLTGPMRAALRAANEVR